MGLFACIFALSLSTSVALAADSDSDSRSTAYAAVRGLQKHLGQGCLSRVLEINGRNGTPQPAIWKMTLTNPGRTSTLSEFDIQGGRVVAHRTVPRTGRLMSDSPINFSLLNLDSSGAFKFANTHAQQAKLPFHGLNYILRADSTGRPVWSLQLLNKQRAPIGTLAVSARDASLVNATGLLSGGRLEAATSLSKSRGSASDSANREQKRSQKSSSQSDRTAARRVGRGRTKFRAVFSNEAGALWIKRVE